MSDTRERRGFTLIELMITVSIFAVIMVSVNLLYMAGTRAYRQSVVIAQMRIQTQRAVHEINRDLVDCRIVDGSNFLDQITIQRPTPRMRSGGDPNVDKRYIDANDQAYWGDGETEIDGSAQVHVGNSIRYQFVQVAAVSEAVDNRDYNRDGDKADTFQRGRIERSVLTAAGAVVGTPRRITGDWVFKAPIPVGTPGNFNNVSAIAAMDLDGLNGPDPVFMIMDNANAPNPAGGRIQIRLFYMSVIDRVPVFQDCSALVTPLNQSATF